MFMFFALYIATLPLVTLPCSFLSCHARYFYGFPLNITVRVLAAGCQLSYRKFYGYFLLCKHLFERIDISLISSSVASFFKMRS